MRGEDLLVRPLPDARKAIDGRAIIAEVRRGYALDPGGIHAVAHRARVTENGLRVAGDSGADVEVVRLSAASLMAQPRHS